MAKPFGDQGVIRQQVVDAPAQQIAERRRVEMRVDVVNGRARDDALDRFVERVGVERRLRGHGGSTPPK